MHVAGCQVAGLGPHFCLCSTISRLRTPTLGDNIQNKTVTCINVEATPDGGIWGEACARTGLAGAKKHFLAVVSLQRKLYKASLHSWKRAASREERGLSMAQLVLMTPPCSSHLLPPFHYKQEGVRLAVRWTVPNIFGQCFWPIKTTFQRRQNISDFFFQIIIFLSFNLFIQSKIKTLYNQNTKHTVVTWKLNFQKFWLGR